jgi:hypothetical protein
MHDTGKNGLWLLVPIYNFYLLTKKGDAGENIYGVDPTIL